MKSRGWLPAALFVGFWALYQATAAHAYSYDAICAALDVEFGSLSEVFHPNHLLYSFLMRILFHIFRAFSDQGRAIYLMQSVDIMTAAAAVAFFGRILSQRFGDGWGALGAIGFGVSNAFWPEAIDPGCYALAGLATIVLLFQLHRTNEKRAFVTGFVHGGLALFHQMLVLAAPAFLFQLAAPRDGKKRGLLRAWLLYGLGLCLSFILVYGVIVALFHGGSLRDRLQWIFGPAGAPSGTKIIGAFWWDWNILNDLKASGDAFTLSFIARPLGGTYGWLLLRGTVLGGLALLIGRSVWLWSTRRSEGGEPISLWLWIAVMSGFQLFFNPGALRFRILFLPALIVIAIAATHRPLRKSIGLLVGLMIGAMAWVNYHAAIRPRRVIPEETFRIAWVRTVVSPRDFLLFSGMEGQSIVNVAMAYFAHDVPARSLYGYWLFPDAKGVMDEMSQRFLSTYQGGGKLFVEKDLLNADWQTRLESLRNVPPGTLGRWMKHLKAVRTYPGPNGYDLVEVVPVFQTR